MTVDFADDRPLTDDILEELGFEGDETTRRSTMKIRGFTLAVNYFGGVRIWVSVLNENIYWRDEYGEETKWKTVGSVRMLIKALKGDE